MDISEKQDQSEKNPDGTTFDQVRHIFIMGLPNSGKSTFFNQLKRIYSDEREMDKKDVNQRVEMIKLYIFHAIAEIASAMPKLSPPIRLESLTSQALAAWLMYYAKLNFDVDKNKVVIFFHFLRFFKILWEDGGFQSALERSKEYNIPQHAKYFFNKIDEIFDKEYVPTEEDILKGYVFPSTTQILDIEYIDITERNARIRREIPDLVEKKGSVSYRVIDLSAEVNKDRCLPCLYNEEIKYDMDYVPWFRQRPKFKNYSILYVFDCSSEEKRKESCKLLRSLINRYHCCCFMIMPIINKWNILVEEAKRNSDDDDEYSVFYNPQLNEIKSGIFDELLDMFLTSRRKFNRKSSEWICGTTGHEMFMSVLDASRVKEMFETCCGNIERMELRAQFEEQIKFIGKQKESGLINFDSDSVTYGNYADREEELL